MKKVILFAAIVAVIGTGCSNDKSATDSAMQSQKEIEAKKDTNWQD